VAATAADLVLAGEPRGIRALPPARPPRGPDVLRRFCYLNNAAVAAARLRRGLDAPVAVIDVDAHHGNGTQAIFYGWMPPPAIPRALCG
jgi:acetoin utilization deacetylase AcuC-like enzyme